MPMGFTGTLLPRRFFRLAATGAGLAAPLNVTRSAYPRGRDLITHPSSSSAFPSDSFFRRSLKMHLLAHSLREAQRPNLSTAMTLCYE